MNPARRLVRLGLALLLGGCGVARFDQTGPKLDDDAYAAVFPTYAEFCAVSQIKKKPGFGAEIRGQVGGHAVFYLNGACREEGAGYPVLRVCDGGGVGLSMNAHFSNAKFVATPGRDFFFQGDLDPEAMLDRAGYLRVRARAQALGIYDGVVFHDAVFADMPAGMTREVYKYEVSVATDYAIALGRGRHCARIPVTPAQMARMVDFLNAENAPYRRGAAIFRWSVFRDNCIHLAHNALAAAGLWPEWRSHDWLLRAMLDFPVPRNEFVNIMQRTNDVTLLEPALADPPETAPPLPGALALARPPMRANAVYDTDVDLIFYDEPVFGRYQQHSDEIFADPRRTGLEANLAWFDGLYRQALARRAVGHDAFYDAIARRRAQVEAGLRLLRRR